MTKIMPHTGERSKGGLVYLNEDTLKDGKMAIGDDVDIKGNPEGIKITPKERGNK